MVIIGATSWHLLLRLFMLFVLLITTFFRSSNFIYWTIDMLCVKKPTIQRPALQELRPAPSQNNLNLTTPFAPFVLSPPPPPPAPPTALPTLPANLIEDTPILLAIDYADWFHTGFNLPLELDVETDWSSIYQYQMHIRNVIKKMKVICCCCELFTSVKESSTLHIHN